MTAEQQAYTQNVDHLMEITPEMEAKLSDLESTVEGLQKSTAGAENMEEIRSIALKTRAETNSDMELMREDMGRLRGKVEELEFEIGSFKAKEIKELRESIGKVNKTVAFLTAKVTKLEKGGGLAGEAAAAADEEAVSEIKEALATLNVTVAELGAAVTRVDGEVSALGEGGAVGDGGAGGLQGIIDTLGAMEARLKSLEEGSGKVKDTEPTPPDPAEMYMLGYRDTMDKNFDDAMKNFGEFLTLYPDHDLADNAQYWVGEIYYARGDWERAILEFDKVIKDYPEGDKVADSLLKQGFSFEKLGDRKTAATLLERIVDEFPGSESARKAKTRLPELK